MITPTMLYWITRLDAINNVFSAACTLSAVIVVASSIAWASTACADDDDGTVVAAIHKKAKRGLTFGWLILFISAVALSLTPTTKEAAFIYTLPKVINSDFVQKDMPAEAKELYSMAKEYLKMQLEDTRNEHKGKD